MPKIEILEMDNQSISKIKVTWVDYTSKARRPWTPPLPHPGYEAVEQVVILKVGET